MEVEWEDVLVFFGRVFRVLDGAVRAVEEPLRVVLHVGMIRGAVESEVERHLHASAAYLADQPLEVGKRPEFGLHRQVATSKGADRIGNSGLTGLAGEGVVGTLAGGDPDRVDRWEVDDVEAHLTRVVDPREAVPEGGSACGLTLRGPRKKLIPGRKGGTGTINADLLERFVGEGERPVGPLLHEFEKLRLRGHDSQFGWASSRLQSKRLEQEFLGPWTFSSPL